MSVTKFSTYDVWRGTRPRPRPGGGVDGDRRLFEARACEFFSWTLSCSKEARGKQSRAPRFAAFGVISNESSVRFHPIRFWIFAQGPQQEQHCFCCAKSRFTITPWLGNHTGYDGSLKPLMKAGFSLGARATRSPVPDVLERDGLRSHAGAANDCEGTDL